MDRRKKMHGDIDKFILMSLLKEGALNLKTLEEKLNLTVNQFMLLGYSIVPAKFWTDEKHRRKERKKRKKDEVDVERECNDLIEKKKISLNQDEKYTLTETGREEAEKITGEIEKSVRRLEKSIMSPSAAAKNTVIVDLFLAIMKLVAGFLSGSVGLIADGADAAIDTVSATVVWIGIKFKKEFLGTLIIVTMMFVTAVSVGYESINKLIKLLIGGMSPLSMPYLVILVEAVALLFAVLLFFYQRFIGKKYGSLALISQSIDSKNHIYVAASVITGAIFSIFGIHFVDALIGAYIAVRIFLDGFELSKEIFSSMRGEETDFNKYEMPLEKHWYFSKTESFRIWILYSMKKYGLTSKEEIINSLKETYQQEYIPLLSEFKFRFGEGIDFAEKFSELTAPLLENKWVIREDDKLILTQTGRDHVDKIFKRMRFHQNV